MNLTTGTSQTVRRRAFAWIGAALFGLSLTLAQAQPPQSSSTLSPTNSATLKAKEPDPKAKAPKAESKARKTKKPAAQKPAPLTGAELYSINCERCHQERYPTERTGAQWKTLLLHMQVRANLPVTQAKLILRFLQENSGR